MTEKQLQYLVLELCGWLRLLAYHTHDSRRSTAGFPDLVIAGRAVLFAELKRDTGRLSPAQIIWGDRLIAVGAWYVVWKPADWQAGTIQSTLKLMA